MKKITDSVNFTAKDKFNLTAASVLNDYHGNLFTIVGAAIGVDAPEGKDPKEFSAFITNDGEIFCSISQTVREGISAIIDMLADGEESVTVALKTGTSKGGREYLYLELQ